MKIAVVGGGSTYSPELAEGLARRSAPLSIEELWLHDVDAPRLDLVGRFVERMVLSIAPNLRVRLSRDLDEALDQADFVVIQIRVGGQAARLEDERLGKRLGVIGQETTGIGGLAKAVRTIPEILQIADRVCELAPNATIINFTNPVSIVTEALLQQNQGRATRIVGLCNIPISQQREIAAHLDVDPSEVAIDSVGLNHLSFVRGVKLRGKEILPDLIAAVSTILKAGGRPANIPDLDFPPELIESLQMIPSDYLRYYFLQQETIGEQQSKKALRAEEVMEIERDLLDCYADETRTDKPESLERRGGTFYSHAALEIIEALMKEDGDRLIVDVRNGGTVPELPPESCVELPCIVSKKEISPTPQRPLEPEIRGLIQHVKAYEELAIRAALSRSRRDLYLALVTHPLTPSAEIATEAADAIVERLAWKSPKN